VKILAIALAGMAGSVLRFAIGEQLLQPLGTLAVNLAGCFLIGWFVSGIKKRINETFAAAIQTGFIGSFTTFSAFSQDMMFLLQEGDYLTFVLYTSASLVGGFILCYAGLAFGERFFVEKRRVHD
jgi:CrcB protein